jgi:hypothetical protein
MPFVDNAVKPPMLDSNGENGTEDSDEPEIDRDTLFPHPSGKIDEYDRHAATYRKVNQKWNLSDRFPNVFR